MKSQRNSPSGGNHSAILSHKHFKISILAITVTTLMILLAFAPVATPAKAMDWDKVWPAAAVNAAAWAGAGFYAFDGIGALVGAGLGAMLVIIPAWLQGENANSALLAQAKEVLAGDIINHTADGLNWAHTNAVNTLTLFNTSLYFFVRKAEWAAQQLYDYQTAHSLSHTYNAEYVLQNSEVANGTMSYQWSVIENYNQVFNGLSQQSQAFTGTYDGMTWGTALYASDLAWHASSSGYASHSYMTDILTMALDPAITHNAKYIFSAGVPLYFVSLGGLPNTDGVATLTLKDTLGAVAYTDTLSIPKGEMMDFDLKSVGLKSGTYYYNLTVTSGLIQGYSNIGAPPSAGAITYPALISGYEDGGQFMVLGVYSRDASHVSWMPLGIQNPLLTTDMANPQVFCAWGGNLQTQAYMTPLDQAWTDIMAVRGRIASTISTVNSFAQSYYFALVNSGGGLTPLPDIVFPDPNQMANLSWQQIYAIYIAYCRALQPWFYNESHLTYNNLTISNQSMDLYCRGAIKSAGGQSLGDNTTVWTPYVSVSDWSLTKGEWNVFPEPGFLIAWGNMTTLENNVTASGNATISSNMTSPGIMYIPMKAGDKVWPVEIYYMGESVDSVDLNVTHLNFIVTATLHHDTGAQAESDWAWLLDHWYLFTGILGVVMMLGALATRRWEIALIGVILIAVSLGAYYFSGGLTGLLGFELGPPGG